VAAAADQQPVQTLGADGADEALGRGIRSRWADRHVDHRDRFAAEDLVEAGAELAVRDDRRCIEALTNCIPVTKLSP
jgi:hypothetical protein